MQLSKRYLWVVEERAGDEWFVTFTVDTSREEIETSINMHKLAFPNTEYRVTKYTPEE